MIFGFITISKRIAVVIFALLPIFSDAGKGEQEITKFICVDQFGYVPLSKKIAIIRSPRVGYDSLDIFQPGKLYAVVNQESTERVLIGAPIRWRNGEIDGSSGDVVWWFDFSRLERVGRYYILDIERNLRSYTFEIRNDIYSDILKQAVRTFFYQRAGFPKQASFAGMQWADEASHLQDAKARDFLRKSDAASEIDVSGGWYDAGDFNRYTSWTANYVISFMKAFIENPGVWGDDYNIPESGNGIPDLLDEAKWGIDHLLRLQRPNGSMLSVVGVSHASPPSTAKGPTYYGTPNTSATLNSAAAFALAAKVYSSVGMKAYSDSLRKAAVEAWNWAAENPRILYTNNFGITSGLAAGNQEIDDYGRLAAKIKAAVYLYELTGEQKYRIFVENNYQQIHLIEWNFAYPFEAVNQETLLYYTRLIGASEGVRSLIIKKYRSAMDRFDNFPAVADNADPYRAHIN